MINFLSRVQDYYCRAVSIVRGMQYATSALCRHNNASHFLRREIARLRANCSHERREARARMHRARVAYAMRRERGKNRKCSVKVRRCLSTYQRECALISTRGFPTIVSISFLSRYRAVTCLDCCNCDRRAS